MRANSATVGSLAAAVLLSSAAVARAGEFSSLARGFARAAQRSGADRVAVLPFKEAGEPSGGLGAAVAERLAFSLAATGRVKLVERQLLDQVMGEHYLGRTGALDPRSLAELGRLLQARAVVVGSCVRLGGAVELHARLVEVESGLVLSAARERTRGDWVTAVSAGPADPFATSAGPTAGDVLEDVARYRRADWLEGYDSPSARVLAAAEGFSAPSEPVRLPAEDFAEGLRDAASARCSGARVRVEALEAGVLELKARYWAWRSQAKRLAPRELAASAGRLGSGRLRGRYFALLELAGRSPRPLDPFETRAFLAADREAFELHQECLAD